MSAVFIFRHLAEQPQVAGHLGIGNGIAYGGSRLFVSRKLTGRRGVDTGLAVCRLPGINAKILESGKSYKERSHPVFGFGE